LEEIEEEHDNIAGHEANVNKSKDTQDTRN
jgi:hypothetical protein